MALFATLVFVPVAGAQVPAVPGSLAQLPGDAGCLKGTGGKAQIPCAPTVRGLFDVSSVAFSDDGRFAYAVSLYAGSKADATGKIINTPGGTIVVFSRDAATGALTQLPGDAGCIKDSAAVTTPVTKPCTVTARGIGGAKEITLSPDGKFAYVTGLESKSIAVFARNAETGQLTQLPGDAGCVRDAAATGVDCSATAIGLHGVRWVSLSSDGRNLYASSPASDAIAAFTRNPTTGAITQLPGDAACIEDKRARPRAHPCPTKGIGLNYPRSLTTSPDGRNVYVASDHADNSFPGDAGNGDAISVFTRDPATGALKQLPGADACIKDTRAPATTECLTKGKGLFGVFEAVVSPDGKFVYTASAYGGTVAAFTRNQQTGALTQLAGTAACLGAYGCKPANGIRGANAITLSPDARFAYVAGFDGRSVANFSRNTTTGELTQLEGDAQCARDVSAGDALAVCPLTISGLNGPRKVTLSPDGRHAYVPASPGTTLSVYTVAADTAPPVEPTPSPGDPTPPPVDPTPPPVDPTPVDPPPVDPTPDSADLRPPVAIVPPGNDMTPSRAATPPRVDPPAPEPTTTVPPPTGDQPPEQSQDSRSGTVPAGAPSGARSAVAPLRTARLTRAGLLTIRLKNPGPAGTRVTVRVSVVQRARRQARVCGRDRRSVPAATVRTARVRLTRTCLRLLRAPGAKLLVEVTGRAANGKATRRSTAVRVRR